MADLISLVPHKEPGVRWSAEPLLMATRRRSYFPQPASSPAHQTHHRQYSLPSLGATMRASLIAPPTLVAIPSSATEWRNTIHEVKRKYLARKYRSCSMQCSEILDGLGGDTSAVEPLHLIYLHFYAASSFEWCARPLSSSSAYRTKLLCSAQTHYAAAEALIVATEWDMAEKARSPSSASTTTTTRPVSPGLSASSRTPSLGESSSSSSSSAASSPRTSVFSLEDEAAPTKPVWPVRVKPKKKVSFSGLPEFFEFQPEPYIRPDSPTLGWDDSRVSALSQHDMIACFPMSPPKKPNPTSIIKPPPLPLLDEKKDHVPTARAGSGSGSSLKTGAKTTTRTADENVTATDRDGNGNGNSTANHHTFNRESFLQTRTLNRLRGQLSALRDQVSRHRAAVDDLLLLPPAPSTPGNDAPQTPDIPRGAWHPDTPCSPRTRLAPPPPPPPPPGPEPRQSRPDRADDRVPPRPTLRLLTNLGERGGDVSNTRQQQHQHQQQQYAVRHDLQRRCSSASTSPWYRPSTPTPTPPTPTSIVSSPLSAIGDGDANPNANALRDRIERLRAAGWRRKRFDGRRYEALRGQVLEELGPRC